MGDRAATMAQIASNTTPPPPPPPPPPEEEDADELDAAAGAQPSPIEKVKEGTEKSKEDDEKDEEDDTDELDAADALRQANEQIQQTTGRIMTFARDLWASVGRVPAPGDIFLPISILLVFFLLILPVNGHTRASWLFLALTGNAHIA
jgi:hypothetical protein